MTFPIGPRPIERSFKIFFQFCVRRVPCSGGTRGDQVQVNAYGLSQTLTMLIVLSQGTCQVNCQLGHVHVVCVAVEEGDN